MAKNTCNIINALIKSMNRFFCVFLYLTILKFSNATNLDSITKKLSFLAEKDLFNGNVVLVKRGKVIYNEAFGYEDPINRIKMTTNSRHKIGSVTKTYTATVLLRLIEKKNLSLHTTLDSYFPEVHNSRRITIEMMLRHRSGIRSYTNDEDYQNYYRAPTATDQILHKIVSYASDFEPDEKFSYSNSNYFLLALIAEKVSGKSYCDLIRNTLSGKSGSNILCCSGTCRDTSIASFEKTDHGWVKSSETYMNVAFGAGNLVATAAEIAGFYDRLFSQKKILKPVQVELMTSFRENIGLGIFRMPFYEKKGYGHTGGIDAFRSMALYFPEDDLTLVLTSNSLTEISLNDVAIGVLSAYYNRSHEFELPGDYMQDPEILDACVGEFISKDIPLEITTYRKKNELYLQATGQPAIRLSPESDSKFVFKQAGVIVEFIDMRENRYSGFILEQGGYRFKFYRK